MSSILNNLLCGKRINEAIKVGQEHGYEILHLIHDDVSNLPPKQDPKKNRVIIIAVPGKLVWKTYFQS